MINRQYCNIEGKWVVTEQPTIKVKDLVAYLLTLDQDWEVGCITEIYGNLPLNLEHDIEIVESEKLVLL
jgi:hypothetical protein